MQHLIAVGSCINPILQIMTSNIHCHMYYSVTGEPFSASDKNNREAVAVTYVELNIYTIKKSETETDMDLATGYSDIKTELSIAHDIPAGKFFTSETWCMLINEAGETLSVNRQDIFPVSFYRNIDKPQQLKIRFNNGSLPGTPEWKDTSLLV